MALMTKVHFRNIIQKTFNCFVNAIVNVCKQLILKIDNSSILPSSSAKLTLKILTLNFALPMAGRKCSLLLIAELVFVRMVML